MKSVTAAVIGILALTCLAVLPRPAIAQPEEIPDATIIMPGLLEPVLFRRDAYNVPHIFARNDHDALFMLGYVHAQDRLFQMDFLRHAFSGTVAELVGAAALPQDIQLRTLGLRRAAAASFPVYSDQGKAWLEAYAEGVNAYLSNAANPLPPEYAALELTRASIGAWTPVDSVVMAKGLAFGLSFDLMDIDLTVSLQAFMQAGAVGGFDGSALFWEDTWRTAPFDPTVAIPGALTAGAKVSPGDGGARWRLAEHLGPQTLALAQQYRDKVRQIPLLRGALERRGDKGGSNWWLTGGPVSESGFPSVTNDPHLGLETPSVFYQAQIRVRAGGADPPMNVYGEGFPGTPGLAVGCNVAICWGATVNPMDVTDVYQESLVINPLSGMPTATIFDGEQEPVVVIPQTYRVNQVGDSVPDNLVDAGVGALDGGLTVIVPRRNNGPIVAVDASDPFNVTALSIQYTGWGPTRELDAFRIWARSYDLDQFTQGLPFFDVGSQNWGYADIEGNIAYFTSAEMPVREDLQLLNAPDGGVPPFLIRDGTHTLMHEWLPVQNPQPGQALPFEILPFEEMPHVINPAHGYVINANNDPVGTTLDNNPLNQLRPGGGLFYLSPGYATGFRAGRIQRLFDQELAGDGTLSRQDLRDIQANNQLLDAEVLVPFILQAFDNAAGALPGSALATLGADPGIVEAVGRLETWDFSTPTGIQQGYDPGDDPANLPLPSNDEIANSVAATIYSVWRGQVVQEVIDGSLANVGLAGFAPGSSVAMAALRHHLDSFATNQGIGASGVPFFQVPGASTPEESRDIILLQSLRDALDLLASDAFELAFEGSPDQDDYRWGYLHRIVYDHPLGGPFSIPPAGGLANVSTDLPGVARAGGFGAVDASSHSARADGLNEFMFGSGPARRFNGELLPDGPNSEDVIPGGESGVLGSPYQADQLLLWLTNQYHPWHYRPNDVKENSEYFEVFLPQ